MRRHQHHRRQRSRHGADQDRMKLPDVRDFIEQGVTDVAFGQGLSAWWPRRRPDIKRSFDLMVEAAERRSPTFGIDTAAQDQAFFEDHRRAGLVWLDLVRPQPRAQ